MQKIIVALSGATGVIYGVKLLEKLRDIEQVESHLVISEWAEKTISLETVYDVERVRSLATCVYNPCNLGARIASGSFLCAGMAIVPCSMKTLSAVANGYADNLISRAADVMLKERRKLFLAVRETPLNNVHLENMLKLSRAGAIIAPPVPAFYNHPRNIDELVGHFVGRILDVFGLSREGDLKRWRGLDGVV